MRTTIQLRKRYLRDALQDPRSLLESWPRVLEAEHVLNMASIGGYFDVNAAENIAAQARRLLGDQYGDPSLFMIAAYYTGSITARGGIRFTVRKASE